jgi:predicted O-methyltransferase YrrM
MKARDRTGVDYYMRAEEVDVLQELARRLPLQPVIVNIGASLGTSACAFLEARPDAVVLSVDLLPCPEEAAALDACGLDMTRCLRILGRSQEIGRRWKWDVDALFIDGGHTYDECQEDFIAWHKHVKSGGWIAFHDYGAIMLPDIKPAIDDLNVPGEVIGRADTLIAYEVK